MPSNKAHVRTKTGLSGHGTLQDLTSAFADLQLPSFGNVSTVVHTAAATNAVLAASSLTKPQPTTSVTEISSDATVLVPFRLLGLATELQSLQLPICERCWSAGATNITKTDSKSTAIVPVDLFKLPLEVRELVYHYVFRGSVVDYTYQSKVTRWTSTHKIWVSAVSSNRNLFRTSKKIYEEAINVYWSETSVRLFGDKYWTVHYFKRFLSRRCLTHLTKLEIRHHSKTYGLGLVTISQNLVELLPKLSELRVNDCSIDLNTSGDEELVEAVLMDEMGLELFFEEAFSLARDIPTVRVYGKVEVDCVQIPPVYTPNRTVCTHKSDLASCGSAC